MADNCGSDEDSLEDRERGRRERGRDEHCHLAKLFLLLDFMLSRVSA
jgi:hypothetical protein